MGDEALCRLLPPNGSCCPRLRRLGLAGTRGIHAEVTIPVLAAALEAGVWPCLQELSLSLLAPRGLAVLSGRAGGETDAVAARLLEQVGGWMWLGSGGFVYRTDERKLTRDFARHDAHKTTARRGPRAADGGAAAL